MKSPNAYKDKYESSDLEIKLGSGFLLGQDAVEDDHEVDVERQDGALLAPVEHRNPAAQPIVYLDGLRGLAALIVYMTHHTSWFLEPNNDLQNGFGWHDGSRYFATLPFVRVFWTGGSAAVSIFFILSGYVLSRSSLRTLRDGGTPYRALISATIRRPFRLFLPPTVISFVFALTMQTPLSPLLEWPPVHSNLFTELWSWLVELLRAMNPFTEHGPFTNWFPYDPPVWTMSYEFKGSLLVFGLLAATSRVKPRLQITICAIFGTLLLFVGEWAMSCFMGGMVLAANDIHGYDEPRLKHYTERTRSVLYWTLFGAGWYLCSQINGVWDPERSYNTYGWYWLTMLTPGSYYKKEYWRFWNSVGALMMVYAILRIRWLQHRLTALKYLGKVSFSFYLVHIPLLWAIGDRIYRFWGIVRPATEGSVGGSIFDNAIVIPDFGPRGFSTRFIFCQLFVFPLTMAVAHYATIYIDEPSIKISRWVSAKVGADRAQ